MYLLVCYEVRAVHLHRIDTLSRDVRVLVVAVMNLSVVLSVVQLLVVDVLRDSVINASVDNCCHELVVTLIEERLDEFIRQTQS